ncbi:MAG TPA: hypothetical protein VFX11_13995 [Candidatus Kapabacteria bacterium]|nr:hypothetical protein [Candidatus Kapabacteria bacterium]
MRNLLKQPAQYALEVWEGGAEEEPERRLATKLVLALLLLALAALTAGG